MDEIDEELLKVTTSETSAPVQEKKKTAVDEEGEISESETEREKAKKKANTNKRKRRGQASESESEEEAFNDGFDDELLGDENDRNHLFSLPEIEREAILLERFQKRKEEQERRALRKQLKQQSGALSASSSQKPSRDRSSVGAKKFKSKQSALSDLKKRRAKITGAVVSSSDEEDPMQADNSEEEEEEEYSSDDYADRDRSRSSTTRKSFRSRESESQRPASAGSESQDTSESLPISDAAQLTKITFTRKFLEKYCEEPFFDNLCPGFFVRIGIGVHNGKSVYRVAEIKGVKEGSKLYHMGKTSTFKLLQLQHANSSAKHFTMEHVSNQPITESEFTKWESEMKKAALKIPSVKDLTAKVQQLNIIYTYHYSNEDVDKVLEKRKNLKGNTPLNFAVAKAELIGRRDAAKDTGDMEEYEKLKVKIEELEIMEKEHALKIQDKTSLINQRNRQANQEVHYEEYADSGPKQNDPFQRRQTRPTNAVVFSTDPNSNGSTSDLSNSSVTPTPAPPPSTFVVKTTAENGGSLKTNATEDPDSTLRKAHDFDLESLPAKTVELTAAQLEAQRISNLSKKPKGATLSLEDYKRRRGLI